MQNLDKWIEAQLKRGYSRKQIKNALIRKGYSQKAVAEVDKIGLSNLPSKNIPKKVSYKPVALVSIVIVIVFLAWLFNALPFSQKQQNLCDEFKEVEYAISCDEAVALALADSPGIVEKVSISPMQIPDFSTGSLDFIEKEAWLVDIKLEKPYFNEKLGKEIKSLRIGVGLNEDIGIHRRPLE